jgi:hypothetical protein
MGRAIDREHMVAGRAFRALAGGIRRQRELLAALPALSFDRRRHRQPGSWTGQYPFTCDASPELIF